MSEKKRFIVKLECVSEVEVFADDWEKARDEVKKKVDLQDRETMKKVANNAGWWEVMHVEHR